MPRTVKNHKVKRKPKGVVQRKPKGVYHGGDQATNNVFISKLQQALQSQIKKQDEEKEKAHNKIMDIKTNLINGNTVSVNDKREIYRANEVLNNTFTSQINGHDNCNYDIVFKAPIYNVAKGAYDSFMTAACASINYSDAHMSLIDNNPFIKLVDGGDINIKRVTGIFDFVYERNYMYIFYLFIFINEGTKGNKGENTLRKILNSKEWPIKPVNEEKLIDEIKSYNRNIELLKKYGIRDPHTKGVPTYREQVGFAVIMVMSAIFFDIMRELANLTVSLNFKDIMPKPDTPNISFSDKDYILLGKCVVNILEQFKTVNPDIKKETSFGSTINLYILFSSFPVSSESMFKFLLNLTNTNVYINDGLELQSEIENPVMIMPTNNIPATLSDTDKILIEEITTPKNKDNAVTIKINNMFDPLLGQKQYTFTDYLNNPNWSNIVMTSTDFYVKYTSAWAIQYESNFICGLMLVEIVYDFYRQTYTNTNQIRWYLNEKTENIPIELTDGTFLVPTCAIPQTVAPTNTGQGTSQGTSQGTGTSMSTVLPYAVGLGVLGAVGTGLYFILGGKTRKQRKKNKKNKKTKKPRVRNTKHTRKYKSGSGRMKQAWTR